MGCKFIKLSCQRWLIRESNKRGPRLIFGMPPRPFGVLQGKSRQDIGLFGVVSNMELLKAAADEFE